MDIRKKKEIIIVINTLKKGGAEKQAVVLANQLSKYHNTSLVVLDIRGANTDLVNILRPDVGKIFLSGMSPYNVISFIRNQKVKSADVIISMLARSNFFAALLGILNRDAKTFGGIRNCCLKKGKYTFELVLHKYFHDYTIFNNHTGMKNLIANGFREEKSICIHNALPSVPDIKEIDKNKSVKIKIISLSRFVPQKNLHTAVNAIHYLVHSLNCKSFLYYMGGYGIEKQSLEKLINEKKLSAYIQIIERPDVHNFIKEGHIFINTSLFEGTSNSILEAMSFSLPVVATDAGDNCYLVKDSYNGFITNIGDYIAIAEKLKILIENPYLRMKYGSNSYDRVKEKFSPEKFTKKYLKLIDE